MRSLLLRNLDLASFRDANSAACIARAISSSSFVSELHELVSLPVQLLQNTENICSISSYFIVEELVFSFQV